jgi:hypothetical protein
MDTGDWHMNINLLPNTLQAENSMSVAQRQLNEDLCCGYHGIIGSTNLIQENCRAKENLKEVSQMIAETGNLLHLGQHRQQLSHQGGSQQNTDCSNTEIL